MRFVDIFVGSTDRTDKVVGAAANSPLAGTAIVRHFCRFRSNSNDKFVTQHLTGLLQRAGKTWKSYQEDIDLTTNSHGQLTNLPLAQNLWSVPLVGIRGTFGPGNYLNAYNNSAQYNYEPKHNPPVFFKDTNGGDNRNASNPLSKNYAPLQQLSFDLAENHVADYNWITPDQYNEMHSRLAAGFAGLTGDASQIRAGDNALSRLVPLIMSSRPQKEWPRQRFDLL